jgi:hypothetical protein
VELAVRNAMCIVTIVPGFRHIAIIVGRQSETCCTQGIVETKQGLLVDPVGEMELALRDCRWLCFAIAELGLQIEQHSAIRRL